MHLQNANLYGSEKSEWQAISSYHLNADDIALYSYKK